MTNHLTLFLAYFFTHFSYDLTQIKGVLEQFPMVYGIFCNVFILSHVILA